MKFKDLKQELLEGVYDPGIFKAFFLAGGAGSGKSYSAAQATGSAAGKFQWHADMKTRELTPGKTGPYGLKVVNSDEQLEAVQALQKSSSDMTTVVKEIEERKKDINLKYKSRMLAVEKLIVPLIENLQKDGETKEYIKWPNRTAILEAQKTKILTITRSEI